MFICFKDVSGTDVIVFQEANGIETPQNVKPSLATSTMSFELMVSFISCESVNGKNN